MEGQSGWDESEEGGDSEGLTEHIRAVVVAPAMVGRPSRIQASRNCRGLWQRRSLEATGICSSPSGWSTRPDGRSVRLRSSSRICRRAGAGPRDSPTTKAGTMIYLDPPDASAGSDPGCAVVVAQRSEHGRSGTMVLIHLVMVSTRAVVSTLVCGQSGPLLSVATSSGAPRLGVVK